MKYTYEFIRTSDDILNDVKANESNLCNFIVTNAETGEKFEKVIKLPFKFGDNFWSLSSDSERVIEFCKKLVKKYDMEV